MSSKLSWQQNHSTLLVFTSKRSFGDLKEVLLSSEVWTQLLLLQRVSIRSPPADPNPPCHFTSTPPTMFKGRSKASTGRGNYGHKHQKVPLKGLFADGVWKCNCDPRLPAQHFQTKNGGKNHERWCRPSPIATSSHDR